MQIAFPLDIEVANLADQQMFDNAVQQLRDTRRRAESANASIYSSRGKYYLEPHNITYTLKFAAITAGVDDSEANWRARVRAFIR